MSTQFHMPQSKAEADPRRWLALAVLLLASFMNLIDVTIVNVALPRLQETLGADASHIEWVVAAYVLAFALGLLPFGRLGDIVGRTRMFLLGVAGFTLASAACGFAPTIEWLIAARVLQGLAAAMMTPQVLAIATVTFPPEERGQSFSLFGLSAGLASVAGPIIGGLLIGADLWGLDWRPIFLVNIPIGILAIALGWFIIPRPPGHPDLKNDYVGIVLFGASMVALVYPLIEGRSLGWPAWTWAMMAASAVGLVLFALWERSREAAGQPQLLNFSLITNRQFLLGAFIATIFASGMPGFFMVISLLLQSGFGLSPLESGLVNTPFSLGVLAISVVSGRFGSSYLRTRVGISAALLVAGMLWLHFVIAGIGDELNTWLFLPPLFISGVGLALGFSALFQAVLANVPPRDAGAGAGSLQAFQQVGGAIGVALIGQIFFSILEGARDWGAASVHEAFTVSASTATWYLVASYVLIFGLVFLLKGRPKTGLGSAGPVAAPIIAEA
jgi:EmrB/QacA subfamily drug resistance transporter